MLFLCEIKTIRIMKKIFFSLLMLFILLETSMAQDVSGQRKDPVGNWKFEAPYAPEGFRGGLISVAPLENKLSATMSFDSLQYKFPAEKVISSADSLHLSVNLDGQYVEVKLRFIDNDNMTGNAVYSEGTVPLTLKRNKEPGADSK
jgi:hypothetical protein